MSGLREALTAIYSQRGELTPKVLVEEARPEAHPLHGRFEWDDAVAGEKYREVQAAQLIRSVQVVYGKDERGREQTIRAFLPMRAPEQEASTYVPAATALADPFTTQILLRECKREIETLRSKYGHLQGFAALLQDAIA